MSKRDYYDVLGLKLDCKPQDIRKNYHKLALKWHPDKHMNKKEATSKFNEINEAYSVLIDPKKKKIYDTYGHKGIRQLQDGDGPFDKMNSFLVKGFQGTDKSAFDILWDILKERDDDSFTQAYKNCDIPEHFKSDFTGFFEDPNFEEDDDESDFFSTYIPTFADEDFLASSYSQFPMFNKPMYTENYMNSYNQSQPSQSYFNGFQQSMPRPQHQFFAAPAQQPSGTNKPASQQSYDFHYNQGLNNSFNPRNAPVIIIEDDESDVSNDNPIPNQTNDPFITQLNEFQFFLNKFHQDLENNRDSLGNLNPNSKKISKHEKVHPSPFSPKERAKRCPLISVPIYS